MKQLIKSVALLGFIFLPLLFETSQASQVTRLAQPVVTAPPANMHGWTDTIEKSDLKWGIGAPDGICWAWSDHAQTWRCDGTLFSCEVVFEYKDGTIVTYSAPCFAYDSFFQYRYDRVLKQYHISNWSNKVKTPPPGTLIIGDVALLPDGTTAPAELYE